MSIVANVTVFECEECHVLTSIKSESDFADFEKTWHTGILHDFCPGCRYKISVQARVLEDEETRFNIAFIQWEVKNANFVN